MDGDSRDRYDDLLFGRIPETPAAVIIADPDPGSKPTEPTPEVSVPTLHIQLSGFDWWVTDKDIEQCLLSVAADLFQLVQLNLLEDESNGRFQGIVDALLRTDAPDNQILGVISRAISEQFMKDERSSRVSARVMRAPTQKPPKPQGPAPPPPPKFKPAPMLYEDTASPIPRYLLAEFSRSDRPKKSDDPKRRSKDRVREGRHERHRTKDKHGRRDDRGRSDSYSDEYDYDYDYDNDRRRKDDRDDRKRRHGDSYHSKKKK
jgi:hypothetical protein